MMNNKLRNIRSVFNRIMRTDFGTALLLAVAWQVAVTLLSVLIDGNIFNFITPQPIGVPLEQSVLSHTLRWDAFFYLDIIKDAYQTSALSPAFYPLFPSVVGLLHFISLDAISLTAIGIFVNTISVWFAVTALIKITKTLHLERVTWFVVAAFLAYPAAFFMHMFYGEAIFCAIAFWSYYFALARNWKAAVLLLAVLSASRIPAILFIALVFFEYCRSYNWRPQKLINPTILLFALTPLGFIAYALYLGYARGDALAMFHSLDAWTYHVFNPNIFATYFHQLTSGIDMIDQATNLKSMHPAIVNILLPLTTLVVLCISSFYTLFKIKDWAIPLGLVGALSCIMFTLNSNVISVHRYILPSLTIYLVLGYLLNTYRRLKYVFFIVLLLSILLQVALLMLYINNYFAG